jgi:phenylacetate-CoA ligase
METATPGPETLVPIPRDPAQKFWDPELQTLDPEERRRRQDVALRRLVRRVFETPVPLFRRKLEAAGVKHADDVRGVDDLSRIPLTRKQDLRDSEAAAPPYGEYRFVDVRRCVRIGTSTGTTGTPTVTMWTRRDLAYEYESAARNFWRTGWRPGMLATHAHPAYLYGGGMLLSGAYEYFGLVNLWVPPPDTDELAEQGIRAWLRFQPDIPFVGFSLGRYFEVSAKLKLDPMKEVGLKIPSLPGGKGIPLMTAGLECFAYLGGSCGAPGGHLNEDRALVQAVDPETGREVADGEWGALVVTTLDRDGALLRYDLEEACSLTREPCACGETTLRGFWGGRFKDLLAAQGRRFQASEIEGALRTVEAVTKPSLEWVVVRPRAGEPGPLHVRVELAEGERDAIAGRCAAAIAQGLGVEARVEIVERGSLPRSGYKTTRVVDS